MTPLVSLSVPCDSPPLDISSTGCCSQSCWSWDDCLECSYDNYYTCVDQVRARKDLKSSFTLTCHMYWVWTIIIIKHFFLVFYGWVTEIWVSPLWVPGKFNIKYESRSEVVTLLGCRWSEFDLILLSCTSGTRFYANFDASDWWHETVPSTSGIRNTGLLW